MNIVCDKVLLSAAIDGVSKAVTMRSAIPVLEGILLKAEGFQLNLTGYDLEMGIEASGLDNLITASYDLLGLISFLTDGKKECRAWTIRKGTKAPQAAGKIHSDFERGFIRASVIGYKDLEANNFDYAAVKAKGLQRTEGKEYVVNDGDVIEFLFNV